MLEQARARDPLGDYRVVPDGDVGSLDPDTYDLILSAFTFDNVPSMDRKVTLFRGLARALTNSGVIVNLVSSPDIYLHEWASFSTRDFPENRAAHSGDRVRIVMLDVPDSRPVEDILWTDGDYLEVYARAGLSVAATFRPLARTSEPYPWVSETRIAPWVIYTLRRD